MYKIKTITLNNFKFFYGKETIQLDKKHALIYGENGSGKSSIYWAIHCFLQSTLKQNVNEVHKYFRPIAESEESIKNRYAADGEGSGVSITLGHDDVERYADITAEVSDRVVNTSTNRTIKLMTLSSELINYKVLYNMYLATNKSSIKLFSYFEKNLMEFIDFDEDLTTIDGERLPRNSLIWWRYIQKGVNPYTTIKDPRYIKFQEDVDLFNRKFSSYLQLITSEINRCLEEDFKEEFSVRFEYTPAVYNDFKYGNDGQPHGRTRKTKCPEIELIVELPHLEGEVAIIKRPQSFLNEARLSAIAIAIRFAILKERYIDDAPRIMVLDDLLLSLDLGNRSMLLNILLKDYASRYQLIILTHDRVFFDCVLNHLSDDELKEKWQIYEMYESDQDNKKGPSIVPYQSPLSKAYIYFKGENTQIDYNACGNNQRQALEGIFKKQFERFSLRKDSGELVSINGLMIADCIAYARQMYTQIGFNLDLLDELEIYRKQSLNPTSHHNPQSNYYKGELNRIFQIIDKLEQYKIEKLVPVDEIIILNVECSDGSIYNYQIQLLDAILAYKMPDRDYFIQENDKRKYCIKKCNDTDCDHVTNGLTLAELYNETLAGIISHLHKTPIRQANPISAFSYMGTNIHELLNAKNRI